MIWSDEAGVTLDEAWAAVMTAPGNLRLLGDVRFCAACGGYTSWTAEPQCGWPSEAGFRSGAACSNGP